MLFLAPFFPPAYLPPAVAGRGAVPAAVHLGQSLDTEQNCRQTRQFFPMILYEHLTKLPPVFDNLDGFFIPLICQIVFECVVVNRVNGQHKWQKVTADSYLTPW